jgi:imidazoleglycerol phosphate dehydratase HisB
LGYRIQTGDGRENNRDVLHFFKSFSDGAKANINIKAEGQNHHKIEADFKGFRQSDQGSCKTRYRKMILPSTKNAKALKLAFGFRQNKSFRYCYCYK